MNLFDFAAQEARKHGLDPDLVLRQMRAESGGNHAAVSPKGARGPMQLMPGTARQFGVDIDDPLDNIRGGVRYLAQQMRDFGSPELALAAYNAGPGNVRKYGGVPPFSETQNYVGKIMGGRSSTPQDDSDIFGAPAAQVGRASARLSGGAVGLKPDPQGRQAADDDSDIFAPSARESSPTIYAQAREAAPQSPGASGKAAPTNSAVLVNSVLKGLAGVPDFALNAPIHLWNGAKGVVGMAANAAGRPDLSPNVTPTPDFVHRGMKAVGLIRDDQEPVTTGQRILDWAGQGAGGGIIGPANGVRQLLTNAALGGASSLAGGAVAEATGSPSAGILASLAALPVAGKVGQAVTRGARNLAGGQDVRTGRILSTAANMSPEALAAQIEKGRVEIVPGSKPTAVQAAGNAGISQLKRSSQSAGADFSGIEEAQNAARIAHLDRIAPGAWMNSGHEAGQMAGDLIVQRTAPRRSASNAAVSRNYESIDPKGEARLTLPTRYVDESMGKYFGEGAGSPSGTLGSLVDDMRSLPDVVPLRTLQNLRSRASELAYKAGQAGDRREAAVAQQVKQHLDAALESAAGRTAMRGVLENGQDAPGAMFRPGLGEVDFTIGDPGRGHGGNGVSHIVRRRTENGDNGQQVAMSIPEVIAHGNLGQPYTVKGDRVRRNVDLGADARAVLQQGEPNHWLLTGWNHSLRGDGSGVSPQPTYADRQLHMQTGQGARNGDGLNIAPHVENFTPDMARAFREAKASKIAHERQFETGPARALWRDGADGVPQRKGAEVARGFFNRGDSQTDDMAQFLRMTEGDLPSRRALLDYAMSNLLEKTRLQGGLLGAKKLEDYTNAHSGALKGLLSEEQMGALDAVKADARRAAVAEALNRVSGPDTAQKLMGAGLLENPWVTRGAALVPKLGPAAVDWLKTIVRTQTARKVGGALIDPDTALKVLKSYERQQAPTVFDRAGRRLAPGVGMGLLGNLPSQQD